MNTFVRVVLLFVATILFGAGINLGYRNFVSAETTAFAAGGLVLLFVFLSQFKRFKGPFGIEGEMWEREMEKAHEITERFRNLATVVAKPLVANSVRMGRWSSGLSRHEIDQMVTEVRSILESSGSSHEEIDAVFRDYRRFTAFDMARPAFDAIKNVLDAKVKEKRNVLDAFGGRIEAHQHEAHKEAVESWRAAEQSTKDVMEVFKIENADSYPEIISAHVNECGLLNEEEKRKLLSSIQDTLDDLAFFRDTGKIRRPDVWFEKPQK